MKRSELENWFKSTEKDEFYKKNLKFIKHDFEVQKDFKIDKTIMLYVPDEDRYIYQAITAQTGLQEDLFLDYIRANKTIHSKAKELLTD